MGDDTASKRGTRTCTISTLEESEGGRISKNRMAMRTLWGKQLAADGVTKRALPQLLKSLVKESMKSLHAFFDQEFQFRICVHAGLCPADYVLSMCRKGLIYRVSQSMTIVYWLTYLSNLSSAIVKLVASNLPSALLLQPPIALFPLSYDTTAFAHILCRRTSSGPLLSNNPGQLWLGLVLSSQRS